MLPFNMGVGGTSGVDTGDIGHSLRCRSAASAYLNRTFGAPTSAYKWSFSTWLKLGNLGTRHILLDSYVDSNNRGYLEINDSGILRYDDFYSSVQRCLKVSTPVYRDPTSWLHIVCECDTDNATAEDRLRIYVNGVRITSWTTNTNYGLSVAPMINWSARVHYINWLNSIVGDGYMARTVFVDNGFGGPTAYAYLNTEINEWVTKSQSAVKAVGDAGGTNSFMLDFDDATSLTTLGYDKSSKGNNWTLNNFSLTAGPNYDHMLDVPGNSYATLNPLNPSSATLSNGNLKGTHAASGNPTILGSIGFAADTSKFAWKFTPGFSTTYIFGIYRLSDGTTYALSQSLTAGTTSEFRIDNGYVTFYPNGSLSGTTFSGVTGTVVPYFYASSASAYEEVDFGQQGYTPPTGFKALCQANLATPAILNPSSAMAHRFEAGSGIAAAIASDRSGWSDWMEWFKRTDTTESWKVRFSDDSGNMMAFDTNGAKAAWSAPSAGTYLGAAFRIGATYGVVTGTYSGDSTSNKNISHSLGKAPTCGIVKNESTGTWYVWHTKMTSAAYFTTLNSATPPAQSNTNTPWGTGNWSSTQFMVTNNATNNLNATGSTYRYILFADIDGLLALLGHTGNASTDGAFESSGHKSQLLIQKDLSATTGFYLWSDKIDTYNVTASYLLLNTNAGTAAATGVDVCSNGTKYRSATIANAANPHMGISYSRTSGKYSLGR